MTTDAMRIAVALGLGWKWWKSYRCRTGYWKLSQPTGERVLYPPNIDNPVAEPTEDMTLSPNLSCIPALTLDWMHSCEGSLTEGEHQLFRDALKDIIVHAASGTISDYERAYVSATKEQRAEAYLKVKNLWNQ